MKKLILLSATIISISLHIQAAHTFIQGTTAKVQTKSGGGVTVKKKDVEVKSKKGGGMTIDKNGLQIKNHRGNGLSIGKGNGK